MTHSFCIHTVQVVANSICNYEFNITQHALDKTCPAWHTTITAVKGFYMCNTGTSVPLKNHVLWHCGAVHPQGYACGSNSLLSSNELQGIGET